MPAQADCGGVAAAQTWSGRERGEVRSEQVVGGAQHEFGLCWIDTRRLGVDQAEIDSAAAQMQGGAPGEQCGPEHARRAAEDAGTAIASFMGVASPWCEMRSKQCRGNQATGRRSVFVRRCKQLRLSPATRISPHWSGRRQ